MRARLAYAAAVLVLAACGSGPSPSASHSPSSAPTVAATPSSSAAPSASPPAGPASLVHCSVTVPAGDNLVIGSVAGDPTVVVRDIQDPANAKNLCTFDPAALAPQFVTATTVTYETPDNQIVKADLASGATAVMATYGTGFGSGQYAVSPDGNSVTYMDGNAWRLAGPSGNRVLTTLPAAPGRGTNPDEDDSFLGYSPDGQYIALFQTYHTGGGGATAADQVRRASDGTLAYSTSGMTMAVWASVPSRLFFRDSSGNMHRWDSSSGVSSMMSLHWIRPRSSPDGRWISYTFRTTSGVGGVGFYSVQGNSISNTSPPGRSGVRFLNNDLVWYIGERACSTCFGGAPSPTGVAYIYDIAGASEITARLAAVQDAWPHYTPPGL
ncbi:MAG TPA: hypothetical protein VMW11_00470 [Candidatus Dormibacteraeota bacterium]|nr:hypothetical protein [Candidatus Dormibacteraeota bacterium]